MSGLVGTAWAHGPGPAVAETGSGVRLEVVVVLLAVGAVYAFGLSRLRRGAFRRSVFLIVALVAASVALLSPLDRLADRSFTAHMLQHMLLIAVAAPAILLADPFPIVVWALPQFARHRSRAWIGRTSVAGRAWRAATAMGPAWLGSACVLWAWHLPGAYDAALASRWLHDLEHVSFVLAAVLFWWPVIHPAPRVRRAAEYPARVAYLLLGTFQTAALGLLLALSPVAHYRAYAEAAGALEDQALGGVIMWGLGGSIEMLAVLALVYRSLGAERAGSGVSNPTR